MKANMHFVAIPSALFLLLNLDEEFVNNYGYIHFLNKEYNLTILNSEDFFKIDYKTIYKIAKKLNKHGKEKK